MIRNTRSTADAEQDPNEGSRPILEVRQLSKSFRTKRGQVEALRDVSFTVATGRIAGLLGPDGAGKTTLMRLIAGLLKPDTGQLRVSGHDACRRTSEIQASIGYMPQRFGLYEDLTVRENLDLYADLQGTAKQLRPGRYDELLQMTGLGPFTSRLAGRLSGGMKQKLGLACVLIRSPRVLLLDEPTAGVDPLSRRELWQIVRRLVDRDGATVLLSTGYLDEAAHCHEVLLFDEGQLLTHDTPDAFTRGLRGRTYAVTSPDVKPRDLQAMLSAKPAVLDASVDRGRVRFVIDPDADVEPGEVLPELPDARWETVPPRLEDSFVVTLQSRRREKPVPSVAGKRSDERSDRLRESSDDSGEVIAVDALQRRFGDFYAVKELSFGVRRGEVFGLLGANGAGKTTTFRMLCGLLPPTAGKLSVAGVDMRRTPARARARIGYMSQKFSLYRDLTVLENLRFFSRAYGLSRRERRGRIDSAVEQFQLESWQDKSSDTLPLGYQQRLALACALLHEPEILFLDEPTSGVDALARREFWRRISDLAARRVTVLVTTHFMEEAEYCDRLAIMMAGEILTLGTPREICAGARSEENPQPSVEDAFVHLIKQRQKHNES